MQARFIHDGKSIDFVSVADVPTGSVIVQGSLIGITKLDVKAGRRGALAVDGVFDVAKGNIVIPLGSLVYWDTIAQQAVLTATDNVQLGVAVQEASAVEPVVRVRIG